MVKISRAERRLKQYNLIEPEIGFLETEVQMAHEMLETLENFHITLEDNVRAKVEMRIQTLMDKIEALRVEKNLIELVIDDIEDTLTQKIFKMKYYSLMTWTDISTKVGYSERQCRRIHKDTLENPLFQKLN